MFLKEADTGRYVRLDSVEAITDSPEGLVAHWRNPDGEIDEIPVNDWDFDPELANATVVPAAPGHFVLQDMYGDLSVKRSAVVAWLVAGQRAYPVTCTNQTTVDLHRKDRAILFPDGHVELGGDYWSAPAQHFDSLADFEREWPAIVEKAMETRAVARERAAARADRTPRVGQTENIVYLPPR